MPIDLAPVTSEESLLPREPQWGFRPATSYSQAFGNFGVKEITETVAMVYGRFVQTPIRDVASWDVATT